MITAIPDDLEALAALYALGLLEGDEGAAFEALLRQKDATAQKHLADFREVVASLAWSAPPQEPSSALRSRLVERVREETPELRVPQAVAVSSGVALILAERISWQETGIPGVRFKPLFVDPVRRYAGSLVMMMPGAIYPRHHHTQLEELFILSGEIVIAGHVVRPGDYSRAEAGTCHEMLRTDMGCMFIALSSLDDKILPEEKEILSELL